MMTEILAQCQPETRLCVASNITLPDAFIQTRTVREWKSQLPDLHKKPTVFLLL